MESYSPIEAFAALHRTDIVTPFATRIFGPYQNTSAETPMELVVKDVAPYLKNHEVSLLTYLCYRVDRRNFDSLLYLLEYIKVCGDEKRTIMQNMLRTSLYSLFLSVDGITTYTTPVLNNQLTGNVVHHHEILSAWFNFFYNVLTGKVGQIKNEWLEDELTVGHAISFRIMFINYSLTELGADKPDDHLQSEFRAHLDCNYNPSTLKGLFMRMGISTTDPKYISYMRTLYSRGVEHRFGLELLPEHQHGSEPHFPDFEKIGLPKERGSLLQVSFSKRQRGGA